MAEPVTCTHVGGVADVRLNRPERRNALDLAMFDALVATGEALARRDDVRAVVLSGEGPGFSAGIDLDLMASGRGADFRRLLHRADGVVGNHAQRAVHVWTALPVPVVAAVHGFAFGGGWELALGADLRIVAPDARFAFPEVGMGLVPDMTGTTTLARLVGLDVAKRLVWTGEEISGERAVQLGLATAVSERPHDDAMALAVRLAAQPAAAVRAAKALLNEAGEASVAHGLLAEEVAVRRLQANRRRS